MKSGSFKYSTNETVSLHSFLYKFVNIKYYKFMIEQKWHIGGILSLLSSHFIYFSVNVLIFPFKDKLVFCLWNHKYHELINKLRDDSDGWISKQDVRTSWNRGEKNLLGAIRVNNGGHEKIWCYSFGEYMQCMHDTYEWFYGRMCGGGG